MKNAGTAKTASVIGSADLRNFFRWAHFTEKWDFNLRALSNAPDASFREDFQRVLKNNAAPSLLSSCYLNDMDSVKLGAFYRSTVSWPRDLAEVAELAQRVREFLGTSQVVLKVIGVGAKLAGPAAVTTPVEQALIQKLDTSSKFSQVDSRYWVCPIEAEVKVITGGSERRERQEFGWVAIEGGPELCALLLVVAERLGNLAAGTQLESGIVLRDQFLSIASHELKTPLTSIYGVLQLQERMLRGAIKGHESEDLPDFAQEEREKQHSYLKLVIKQVKRLNELIDGLLNVSRIQNGRFLVEPSDTDVAALVRDTITGRLNVFAQEAGVRLQLEAPERVVAFVDPVRFEEVVTNLVLNAIRFSPEGGVVWIRLKDQAGELRIEVRDQGAPVAVEDRERIFKPFERAKSVVRMGGLGLGLFISRQIAQIHGGDVTIQEVQGGNGNLFEARFPARPASKMSA